MAYKIFYPDGTVIHHEHAGTVLSVSNPKMRRYLYDLLTVFGQMNDKDVPAHHMSMSVKQRQDLLHRGWMFHDENYRNHYNLIKG